MSLKKKKKKRRSTSSSSGSFSGGVLTPARPARRRKHVTRLNRRMLKKLSVLSSKISGSIKNNISMIKSNSGRFASLYMANDRGPVMLVSTPNIRPDRGDAEELAGDLRQMYGEESGADMPRTLVMHVDRGREAEARDLARALVDEVNRTSTDGRQYTLSEPERDIPDRQTVSLIFRVEEGSGGNGRPLRDRDKGEEESSEDEGRALDRVLTRPRGEAVVNPAAVRNQEIMTEVLGPPASRLDFPEKQNLSRDESARLENFVRFDGRTFSMSDSFVAALEHLARISKEGGLFERVMRDLEAFKKLGPNDPGLEALRTFVEYQVFRTGEHLKTGDEDYWTSEITALVIQEHRDLPKRLLSEEAAAELATAVVAAAERDQAAVDEALKPEPVTAKRKPDPPRKALMADLLSAVQAKKIRAEGKKSSLDKALKDERGEARLRLQKAVFAMIEDPAAEVPRDIQEMGITTDMVRKAIEGRLKELVKPEVEKNYMCPCLYSEPSPTLIRRDMPGFVRDRLRAQDRGETVHIFEAKNGYSIAFDPRLLGLDPAKRYTIAQVAEKSKEVRAFLERYQREGKKVKEPQEELVPFDSEKFMIADVQVPVMAQAVSIRLRPDGLPAFDLKIGKDPAEVGVKMTDEPAGVFKRSLNSQRVIEIADWNEQGEKVVFQLKGSGVPAYGFMSDPDWSGGEYLALNIEKGAMLFRDFVAEVFGHTDVVPEMVGVAMVADPEVTTNEEKAGRFGAVSFRIDRALGVRLSNITYESVARNLSDREEVLAVTGSAGWRIALAAKMARNMALANLFGLQYNDSGVTKLADVGLHGEFADTGGLWNLDQPPQLLRFALLAGIRQHLGGKAAEEFESRYISEMLGALKSIGAKVGQPLAGRISALRDKFAALEPNTLANLLFDATGGSDQEPTVGQRAYAAGGIRQFADVLVSRLEDALS
jgi:hypothetical protein